MGDEEVIQPEPEIEVAFDVSPTRWRWLDALAEARRPGSTGFPAASTDIVDLTEFVDRVHRHDTQVVSEPEDEETFYVVPHKRVYELALHYEEALSALERAREPLRFISSGPIPGPPPSPFAAEQATDLPAQGGLALQSPPTAAKHLAWGFLRRGVLVAWGVVLSSVFIAVGSWSLMLMVMYLGAATFCSADYAAYRIAGDQWFLPPRAALMGIYGFTGLSLTMLVATI